MSFPATAFHDRMSFDYCRLVRDCCQIKKCRECATKVVILPQDGDLAGMNSVGESLLS